MYVPPYQAFLTMAAASAKRQDSNSVLIPEAALKLLLQMALSQAEFDETSYLRENPDVAQSMRRSAVPNAKHHYINYGYFEARAGGVPVDSAWYEKQYPDVAQAMRTGKTRVKSAAEHFHVAGAAEGRAPNASSQAAASTWIKAFGS
jgi:hypothetical protein